MLTGDLFAIRENGLDLLPVPPDRALTEAPEHLFVAPVAESRASRLSRVVPSTVVSIAVHAGLVVLFLIFWHAMVDDLSSSEPISVEIVDRIPGEAPAKAAPKPKDTPKDETKPAEKPPAPEVKPRSALEEALPPPPSAPATPPPPTAPTAPATPNPQGAPQGSVATPTPALVEPPPEPKAAAVQTEQSPKPNASEDKAKDLTQPEPAKPQPAPTVLTSPQSETSVPKAATDPAPPVPTKPADADPQAAKDPTALLAAALPMNPMAMPTTFRSMLSSAGQSDSQDYKGAFYGVFNRLNIKSVVATARRHGMKEATVVLGITVASSGAVDGVSVIQSSGRADVDAALVDLIRHQATFPPPPPGAVRSYTPSISFGEN